MQARSWPGYINQTTVATTPDPEKNAEQISSQLIRPHGPVADSVSKAGPFRSRQTKRGRKKPSPGQPSPLKTEPRPDPIRGLLAVTSDPGLSRT